MKKSKIIQIALNEAEYAVGGMFKMISAERAKQKKLFALHDKLQSRRDHVEDQIDADIESLHNDRQQLQSDMENDPDVIANVERGDSGPVAEYGDQLMAVDDQIAQLMNRKAKWAVKAKAIEDEIASTHKKLGDLAGGTMSALRGENMTKSGLKQIIKEELTNVLTEDSTSSQKGTQLAKTIVAKLRIKFKKLTPQEYDDFMEEIAFSFDLIKKH